MIKVMLDDYGIMPTKAHEADAGWDIYSPVSVVIPKKSSVTIDTGVHVAIPENEVGFIKSKSGLNVKHDIVSEGVIDCGYTGSIKVKLHNLGRAAYAINKGDKITQLVVLVFNPESFVLVDALDDTERGDNGLGSSGR